MITTGKRIRIARLAANMTQKQVGEKCGMADSNIRAYELGKANPKLATLQKIADARGVSVDFLTGHAPFNDLNLLDEYRSVIIAGLEKEGILHNIFPGNVSELDYYKYVSDNIVSLELEKEASVLDIQFKNKSKANDVAPHRKFGYVKMAANLDFNDIINKLYEDNQLVAAYRILNDLYILNHLGEDAALTYIEDLAEIPKYKKD